MNSSVRIQGSGFKGFSAVVVLLWESWGLSKWVKDGDKP